MSTVPPTTIVYPTNSCHNKVKDSPSMSYNMSIHVVQVVYVVQIVHVVQATLVVEVM